MNNTLGTVHKIYNYAQPRQLVPTSDTLEGIIIVSESKNMSYIYRGMSEICNFLDVCIFNFAALQIFTYVVTTHPGYTTCHMEMLSV